MVIFFFDPLNKMSNGAGPQKLMINLFWPNIPQFIFKLYISYTILYGYRTTFTIVLNEICCVFADVVSAHRTSSFGIQILTNLFPL